MGNTPFQEQEAKWEADIAFRVEKLGFNPTSSTTLSDGLTCRQAEDNVRERISIAGGNEPGAYDVEIFEEEWEYGYILAGYSERDREILYLWVVTGKEYDSIVGPAEFVYRGYHHFIVRKDGRFASYGDGMVGDPTLFNTQEEAVADAKAFTDMIAEDQGEGSHGPLGWCEGCQKWFDLNLGDHWTVPALNEHGDKENYYAHEYCMAETDLEARVEIW